MNKTSADTVTINKDKSEKSDWKWWQFGTKTFLSSFVCNFSYTTMRAKEDKVAKLSCVYNSIMLQTPGKLWAAKTSPFQLETARIYIKVCLQVFLRDALQSVLNFPWQCCNLNESSHYLSSSSVNTNLMILYRHISDCFSLFEND